jgi:uncharacterized protein YkwD
MSLACSAFATDDPAQIADALFERLQTGRAEAGVARLERPAALDEAARAHAVQVAALPHAKRLTVSEPIGDRVRAAGIALYRSVTLHLDMQRGYANPASAFHENWRRGPAWQTAMERRFHSVGLAVAVGSDGWFVLAAVFLEPLPVPDDIALVERQTIDAVNARRVESGLSVLATDPDLTAVARGHSEDMAARGYFAHASPEGRHVIDRVRVTSVAFRSLAENIYQARGMDDPVQSAVQAWMASESHRVNILGATFTRTGIGVAVDGDGNVYFTQVFLAP